MAAEPQDSAAQHTAYIQQLIDMSRLVFKDVPDDGAIRPHINEVDFDKSNMIRMVRALSWLKRELEFDLPDPDLSFIMNWVAFEAIYSNDEFLRAPPSKPSPKSVLQITDFVNRIIANTLQESDRQRLPAVIERSWSHVHNLFANKYISPKCWRAYYGGTTRAGPKHNPFREEQSPPAKKVLKDPQQFRSFIEELFTRLYYLRNQVFHGNATYKGGAETERSAQINDGMQVMRNVMPVFIHIMLVDLEGNISDEKWGRVPYPRIQT